VVFEPDRDSVKSLERPMGREREDQNVDYLNVKFFSPENIDVRDVPPPGTWRHD
jgi:hypothetical protein